MRKLLCSLVCLLLFASVVAQTKWYDPLEGAVPNIQGRAWNVEIGKSYNRFPLRVKQIVRKPVWDLSEDCAGLYIKFYTNAPEITIRYQLKGNGLSLPNVETIACSGLDLYVTDVDGMTNWCACPANYRFGRSNADTVTYHYTNLEYKKIKRGDEYQLFLPLYNGVKWMQIGVPEGAMFSFASQSQEKPIVVYGTSIAQGASASRPAMAWSNIVQRRTQYPVINLGFSGNGQMDTAIYDLLSEIDAKMYIIDCMPNMYGLRDSILSRTLSGVKKLRTKSVAPILLVENDGYMYGKTNRLIENECNVTNRELHKAYEQLQLMGVKNVYYITREEIGLTPDSQVDGWHVSDIGMQLYADAYIKKINEIFDYHPMAKFAPVPQRRDGGYEWEQRHNQVITQNYRTNPEILMIGNSITHYWSGSPVDKIARGPKSWNKLFGKKRITNMGFGWDCIENVFWRFYHGELEGCQPKQIFLMIGTNNLGINTNEEIVDGILGIVRMLRERQPQAKLHVVKIYPRRKMEQRIADLNAFLQQKLMIDEQHIDLVDVTSSLTLRDGSGKIDETLFVDGLHPNEAGYAKIAEVYKKYIK